MSALVEWLIQLGDALAGDADMDVPCGDCTACCTSSQFVHLSPADHEALERIPDALLFPAPGLPDGHRVMGYDEHGRCPMLVDGACSIYEVRPRTCRTYDCRVFSVSGVEPVDQPAIAERARRWHLGSDEEWSSRILEAVDPQITRPLDRALRAVGPVAVSLSGRRDRDPTAEG